MTQAQEAPKDEPKTMSIPERKQFTCRKLTQIFSSKLMEERLLKMAGGDASRVAKNLTSFLSVISQDDGSGKEGAKKWYCQCSLPSLTACFLESMNMQLPFDSRKLVSMVIYDWEAELDISYKGFVNSLNRHFTNAFVECKLVFDDDLFVPKIHGRVASYIYEPKDPFAVVTSKYENVRGGYCFFSYIDTDGMETSRLVFLSKSQILKNMSRAKTKYVWESDPKVMAEKTCIREGTRLPFAAIDLDVDMEEVANRHYVLEKPPTMERLSNLMKAQEEIVDDKSKEISPGAVSEEAPQSNLPAEAKKTSVDKPEKRIELPKDNEKTAVSPAKEAPPIIDNDDIFPGDR